MTVRELIEFLETMPMDSVITDVYNHKLMEVCFEPSEEYPYDLNVWLVFEGEI